MIGPEVFPQKKKIGRRVKFFWGEKNWWIDALLQLNACKNLRHCKHATRIIYHGKGSQSSTVLFQSPSKNLGFGSWSYSGNWKPQSYLIYPPCHQQRLPAENICQPSAKECRGSDYRKTTLLTNRSPNKKDSNQISSSTAPHWQLPVGTRSYSHCGCDVTVGISHKVGLGG